MITVIPQSIIGEADEAASGSASVHPVLSIRSVGSDQFQATAPLLVSPSTHSSGATLLAALRRDRSDGVNPAGCESGARRCRFVINALRREIDRLHRAPCEVVRITPEAGHCAGNGDAGARLGSDPASSRSIWAGRPSYAPPAIGDIAALPPREPLPPATPRIVNRYQVVSNHANMVDLFA